MRGVSRREIPISLHREWVPFVSYGTITVVDRSAFGAYGKPGFSKPGLSNAVWTMESARKEQADEVGFAMSDAPHVSNAKSLDLPAGRNTAVCREYMYDGKTQLLHCSIVETPLQFSYIGSRSAEVDAERMLASLN